MDEPTYTFRVYQGGMPVAAVTGPKKQAQREAAHYALVYGQDGPVRVTGRKNPKRKEKDTRP